MRLIPRLLLAPAALLVLCALFASRALAWCGPSFANPAVLSKSKVISTVEAITADTIDADDPRGYYEIPRGARNIRFTFLATTNAGFSTGTNFFVGRILGADDPSGTFTRVAGLETAELVVDVAQQVPSAANAPGVALPRFIKVEWDETGTITDFDATCRIHYELPQGPGRQYEANELGG